MAKQIDELIIYHFNLRFKPSLLRILPTCFTSSWIRFLRPRVMRDLPSHVLSDCISAPFNLLRPFSAVWFLHSKNTFNCSVERIPQSGLRNDSFLQSVSDVPAIQIKIWNFLATCCGVRFSANAGPGDTSDGYNMEVAVSR